MIPQRVHLLKCWKEPWREVVLGRKPFEVRRCDRDFQVGDGLFLQEFDRDKNRYTGWQILVRVISIVGADGVPREPFAIRDHEGYRLVVLGVERLGEPFRVVQPLAPNGVESLPPQGASKP